MKLILLTIILLALAFAGISLKLWLKKEGEFAGTCASQNPHLNPEGKACISCKKSINTDACTKNTKHTRH